MSAHLDRVRHRLGTDAEAGSVTVFLAITVTGLLILVGLVADGGAKLRATQRADTIAAEAARTAGQAIETGTVTIAPDGTTLEVTVTTSSPTVFLGLIGISTLSVTGHGQVALVHGVTGGGT
jgi:hypothetical protein